jgi:transcriptional regulator with XRE-family HTH domain
MNKVSCYVRTQRLMSGLTQKDLQALLPTTGRNRVSTTERGLHPPNGGEILAYEVIFGLSVDELFPKEYIAAEEVVIAKAYALHQKLEGKTDATSAKKRAFLEAVLARAVDRRQRKGL